MHYRMQYPSPPYAYDVQQTDVRTRPTTWLYMFEITMIAYHTPASWPKAPTTPTTLEKSMAHTPTSQTIRFLSCFFCNARSFLSKSSSCIVRGLDWLVPLGPAAKGSTPLSGKADGVCSNGVRGGTTIASGRLKKCVHICTKAGTKNVLVNVMKRSTSVTNAKMPDELRKKSLSLPS